MTEPSLKEIWDEMDEETQKAVCVLVGPDTSIIERMAIVYILRSPELLEVIHDN